MRRVKHKIENRNTPTLRLPCCKAARTRKPHPGLQDKAQAALPYKVASRLHIHAMAHRTRTARRGVVSAMKRGLWRIAIHAFSSLLASHSRTRRSQRRAGGPTVDHCERGGVQAWYEAIVVRRAASESTWCAQRRMCIAVEGETAPPLQSRIPAAGIATTTASCPACSRDRHGANKVVPWLADAFGTKGPSLRCGSFSAYKQPPCATTERGVCPSFATLPATRGGSRR